MIEAIPGHFHDTQISEGWKTSIRIPTRGGFALLSGYLILLLVLLASVRTVSGATPGYLHPEVLESDNADALAKFCSRTLRKTEEFWHAEFTARGLRYREPKLVLFEGSVQSGCGRGISEMGPFYCPLDRKVYLDLSFFRELEQRFGAPGDFPRAYVIAHEVAHHVQTLMGITDKVQSLKNQNPRQSNQLQVRLELQADALAGVFARWLERLSHEGRQPILEPGDIEEGIAAAAAIGDDMIQRRTTGHVIPDSFTHGSSEERVKWFLRGYQTGDIDRCDTFAVEQP